MKKLLLSLLTISMVSLTGFAKDAVKTTPAKNREPSQVTGHVGKELSFKIRKAYPTEKELICNLADKYLESISADAAVDIQHCLKKASIRARMVTEATFNITATIKLNNPSGAPMNFYCEVSYVGQALEKNIVSPVSCSSEKQ